MKTSPLQETLSYYFCCLCYDAISILEYSVNWEHDRGVIIWKGLGRKRSETTLGIVPECAWIDEFFFFYSYLNLQSTRHSVSIK
jgi:hypothetical protein